MKHLLIPFAWLLAPVLLHGQVHEDHKFLPADGIPDGATDGVTNPMPL